MYIPTALSIYYVSVAVIDITAALTTLCMPSLVCGSEEVGEREAGGIVELHSS